MVLVLISIAILVIAAWFFANRDPQRRIEHRAGYLSPADGKVVDIIKVDSRAVFVNKKKHGITAILDDFKQAKYLIVIMMRVWDVHTQRAPISGVVSDIKYKKGSFKNAVFGDYKKATVENENLSINIQGGKPCKVYLVAGLLSRRIKSLVKAGDKVEQGDRIGRIYVGSQVVLALPECEILVNKEDHVLAGITEVAR